MTESQSKATRTKWGQARIGGRPVPALAIAIPLGLLLALGLGLLVQSLQGGAENAARSVAVFALAVAVPMMGLVYALVVDRTTIAGAVARPEESVESRWYDQAASGAFTDLLFAGGIGAVAASFLRWHADVNLVLGGLLLFAFASFGIRYVRLRRSA